MTDDFNIFRIRMKDADLVDYSKKVWEMNQVGIWYGDWTAENLDEAIKRYNEYGTAESLKYMNDLAKDWGWNGYNNQNFHTCWRFRDITEKDWVLVYFEEKLHIGQLKGGIKTKKQSECSVDNGFFHFRHVIEETKKEFPLIDLPDSYRLLAAAGRGNVHQHNSAYTEMLKILVKNTSPAEVVKYYKSLSVDDWLNMISDREWESLCLGYLILKYDYVPSGLLPGRTLIDYDLVGRTRAGKQILAQCKKSPYPYPVEQSFLNTCNNSNDSEVMWFWCAYRGWGEGFSHDRIELVDKECIKKWMETKGGKGKSYLNVLRG